MKPWKTLSRRTVLDLGKFLTVEERAVELPDGRVISDWPWIITPDFVNVVVVADDNRFLCFRQYKYAVQGTTLAPVGGYLEPGEQPLAGAQRELLEETGYAARRWIDLGHFAVDGNRGVAVANLFLALGAHRVAEIHADDLEEQQLVLLTRAEIETALANGEFRLLPWSANIALALLRLDRGVDNSVPQK